MSSSQTDQPTKSLLADVSVLSRQALSERWATIYSQPPPKGIGRRLLEHAVAYQSQAVGGRGLSTAAQKKIRQLAKSQEKHCKRKRPSETKALEPSSRLVREWGGQTHYVDVTEQGFSYRGQSYRSLSQIARAITGTRWSGPRFFGL